MKYSILCLFPLIVISKAALANLHCTAQYIESNGNEMGQRKVLGEKLYQSNEIEGLDREAFKINEKINEDYFNLKLAPKFNQDKKSYEVEATVLVNKGRKDLPGQFESNGPNGFSYRIHLEPVLKKPSFIQFECKSLNKNPTHPEKMEIERPHWNNPSTRCQGSNESDNMVLDTMSLEEVVQLFSEPAADKRSSGANNAKKNNLIIINHRSKEKNEAPTRAKNLVNRRRVNKEVTAMEDQEIFGSSLPSSRTVHSDFDKDFTPNPESHEETPSNDTPNSHTAELNEHPTQIDHPSQDLNPDEQDFREKILNLKSRVKTLNDKKIKQQQIAVSAGISLNTLKNYLNPNIQKTPTAIQNLDRIEKAVVTFETPMSLDSKIDKASGLASVPFEDSQVQERIQNLKIKISHLPAPYTNASEFFRYAGIDIQVAKLQLGYKTIKQKNVSTDLLRKVQDALTKLGVDPLSAEDQTPVEPKKKPRLESDFIDFADIQEEFNSMRENAKIHGFSEASILRDAHAREGLFSNLSSGKNTTVELAVWENIRKAYSNLLKTHEDNEKQLRSTESIRKQIDDYNTRINALSSISFERFLELAGIELGEGRIALERSSKKPTEYVSLNTLRKVSLALEKLEQPSTLEDKINDLKGYRYVSPKDDPEVIPYLKTLRERIAKLPPPYSKEDEFLKFAKVSKALGKNHLGYTSKFDTLKKVSLDVLYQVLQALNQLEKNNSNKN